MNALQTLSKEPQLVEAVIANIYANQIYNKMYSEVVDWEHNLKKGLEEVTNAFDQLNLYISLGIVDEYQCAFSSSKKFFQSVKDDITGLSRTIKEYKKELTKLLYRGGEIESLGYSLPHKHERLGKAIEVFLTELNAKLNEFERIIAGTGYPDSEVYYSFDF